MFANYSALMSAGYANLAFFSSLRERACFKYALQTYHATRINKLQFDLFILQ